MNPLKRLGIALWRTLLDQGDLIATQILLPPIAGAIGTRVRIAATGTHIPHEGPSRLASYRKAVTRTVDGAVLDGEAPGTWAKYAIPKGLPTKEGERRMAIENQAHSVEERSFVIKEGYGKGTKTLVYAAPQPTRSTARASSAAWPFTITTPTKPGRITTWSAKACLPAPSGGSWPCTTGRLRAAMPSWMPPAP